MGIAFHKMNGLGNDFVIIDVRSAPIEIDSDFVRHICSREEGIGCDQLILIERPSLGGDIFASLRIWNRDGGMTGMCGNGVRCVGDILLKESGYSSLQIGVGDRSIGIYRESLDGVYIDMGVALFDWERIPLAEEFADTRRIELQIGPIDAPILHSPSVVNIGNPHCIFWVEDVCSYDLGHIGALLEHHPLFPEGANISLGHIIDMNHIRLRVWERGAGLTQACGSGACAVFACAHRLGRVEGEVCVTLPGGDVRVWRRARDGHIFLSGPIAYEFSGIFPYEGSLDEGSRDEGSLDEGSFGSTDGTEI